jgi:ferredoxin
MRRDRADLTDRQVTSLVARAASSRIVSGVVAFALFMDYLIYGLLIPLTPHSPAHATSEQQFGLLYGAYSVGVLAATPVFGYLGDRIGYRRTMISGVLLSAIGLVFKPEAPVRTGILGDGAATVRFAKSGVTAQWSRDSGTLLELAEAVGLAPVFGCRSGICGTCATRIISGAVDYIEEPLAPRGEDQVLLCCSVPAPASASCGANAGLVLDL